MSEMNAGHIVAAFADQGDLGFVAADGGTSIDTTVLTDRGVLRVDLKPAQGWRQGVLELNLRKMADQAQGKRLAALRFQAMFPKDLVTLPGWKNLVPILQTTFNPWMQGNEIDLNAFKPDRWAPIHFGFHKAGEAKAPDAADGMSVGALEKMLFAFNSQHVTGGSFYLGDFEFFYA